MTPTISPSELKSRIESGEPLRLLDVRRPDDFAAAPELIPGAEKVDPTQVEAWAATLSPDQPVVLYCARGGSISTSIQQQLEQKGLKAVYVQGGYAAWKDASHG